MTGDPVDDASDQLLKAIEDSNSWREPPRPTRRRARSTSLRCRSSGRTGRNQLVGRWLWRRLNENLADAAAPEGESEFHEVGGEGG